MNEAFQEFNHRLQRQGQRYEALSPVDQPRVQVRFPGHFEGRDVIWDACLQTLRYEYEHAASRPKRSPATLRQYILIEPAVDDRMPITVALNVPQFDEPSILKTIIMIHNYKRLRLGRHEFGEPVIFSG